MPDWVFHDGGEVAGLEWDMLRVVLFDETRWASVLLTDALFKSSTV